MAAVRVCSAAQTLDWHSCSIQIQNCLLIDRHIRRKEYKNSYIDFINEQICDGTGIMIKGAADRVERRLRRKAAEVYSAYFKLSKRKREKYDKSYSTLKLYQDEIVQPKDIIGLQSQLEKLS